MAYFPTICIDCHYELRYISADLMDNRKACPVCDGTEGEVDLYVKFKELDTDSIPLLRFMHGKSPQKQ